MDPKLFVLLENIRSAYNVGSIFRTCDAAGVHKLFLTGYTPYPPHPKLNKTALGSLKSVAWEYNEEPLKAVRTLMQKNIQILALETGVGGESIFDTEFTSNTCLIVGNEKHGVSKKLLKECGSVVQIPQFGKKESLNVAVAAGVGIYEFTRKRLKRQRKSK